jgi:hypothetical protein
MEKGDVPTLKTEKEIYSYISEHLETLIPGLRVNEFIHG